MAGLEIRTSEVQPQQYDEQTLYSMPLPELAKLPDQIAIQALMKRNPQTLPNPVVAAQALKEIRGGQAQPIEPPVHEPSFSERFKEGSEQAQEGFAKTVGHVVPDWVARGASKALIPDTPGQAAADLALMGMSLIPPTAPVAGPLLAGRWTGRAARIALPTLVSGKVEEATGGNPRESALNTLMGTTVGEVASPFARLALSPLMRSQFNNVDASRTFRALGKEVPVFKQELDNITSQARQMGAGMNEAGANWALLYGGRGATVLSRMMQHAEGAVVQAAGGAQIVVPAINQRFGRAQGAAVSVAQALKEKKLMNDEARSTLMTQHLLSTKGFNIRQLSRDAENQFATSVQNLNLPNDVLNVYQMARENFKKGTAILDFYKETYPFRGNAGRNPEMDLSRAQEALGEQYQDLMKRGVSPEFVNEALLRGANPGAVDVNMPLGQSRGYAERGSVSVPLHGLLEFQRRAGAPLSLPVGPGMRMYNAYPTIMDVLGGHAAHILNIHQAITP